MCFSNNDFYDAAWFYRSTLNICVAMGLEMLKVKFQLTGFINSSQA
jgi:hypothetical protein